MPRLTIVIVTYNSTGHIAACLDSLAEHRPHVSHETIVVDNQSQDATTEFVRRRWRDVRVIEAGRNRGFSAANNLAIRQTTGEFVLLLNPDTIVPAGAVDGLVARLDRRPDVAVVGPRLVDGRGLVELSFGPMIGPFAELRQKYLVTAHDRGIRLVNAYVHRLTGRQREVDWVSGACLMVRRGDIEAVGLFDERYFMYTEDVDLCAAVRARGRKVLFESDVVVQHLRGRSRASAAAATTAAYRRSQIAFYEKHHPAFAPILRLYLKLRGALPDTLGNPGS